MPSVRDAEQIKAIIKERDIEYLVHVTRMSNLESILERGLLTQKQLKEQGLNFIPSDPKRLDDHPDATCCSISFPNSIMFYDKIQNTDDWIVIGVSTDILLEKDCAFYRTNAASGEFRNKDANDFKDAVNFQAMFEEWGDGKWTRARLKQPANYTTNPQAEVLVFDHIEKKHLVGVCMSDENMVNEWNAKELGIEFFVRPDLFRNRHDWNSWWWGT